MQPKELLAPWLVIQIVIILEACCISQLSLSSQAPECYFLWRRGAKDPRVKTTNNSKNQPMLLSKTEFNSPHPSNDITTTVYNLPTALLSACAHTNIALCCQSPVRPCLAGWKLVGVNLQLSSLSSPHFWGITHLQRGTPHITVLSHKASHRIKDAPGIVQSSGPAPCYRQRDLKY